MKCRQFLLAKDGNPEGLIEDACGINDDRESGLLRCAVADGATESYCAGYWATLLTEAYCRGDLENDKFAATLAEIQAIWSEHVSRRELPWYAQEKALGGAFAALVGLTVDTAMNADNSRFFHALALGDSCLFHYRAGKLIYSMPISNALDFGNNPYLISSKQENNADLPERIVRVDGIWMPGDQFVLMTDAVSAWLLQREQEAAAPLCEIEEMTEESFVSWVEGMRRARLENGRPLLKNDDVTVLHLILTEV